MKKGEAILHVMQDEKFVDYYIEQAESICPGRSTYWVTMSNPASEVRYVKSKLVEKVEWVSHSIVDRIKEANTYNCIVLHGFLQDHMHAFVLNVRKDIRLVWMFWGGDGYGFTSNWQRWYLPATLSWKNQNLKKSVSITRYLGRRIKNYWEKYIKSYRVRNIIRRVNICATWVRYDYEMIRHINSDMQWRHYSYFTDKQIGIGNPVPRPLNISRIWLGNSASDTNNHFDALDHLEQIEWAGEIVVPLSYGSRTYADEVISYGRNKFGKMLIPILEFMPLEEYQECMNSCGIVWMNHIRQQAAGNTLLALYMGKILVLNRQNTLYETYKDWGLDVFTSEDIRTVDKCKIDFRLTRDAIRKELGLGKNLPLIREIYNDK